MDNSKKNEIIFDALIKSALEQYVNETVDSYPSYEELKKLYPIPKSGLKRLKKAYKLRRHRKTATFLAAFAAIISAAVILALLPGIAQSAGEFFKGVFAISGSDAPNVSDTASENSDIIYDYDISYIPEGYTQRETSLSPNRGYYCYFDDNGRYIYISISLADRTSVSLEKDTFEHERLNINGRKCHLAYNASNNYGTAIIADNGFVIQIDAIAEKTEILKIAEGMLEEDQKDSSSDSLPVILY